MIPLYSLLIGRWHLIFTRTSRSRRLHETTLPRARELRIGRAALIHSPITSLMLWWRRILWLVALLLDVVVCHAPARLLLPLWILLR